MKIKDMEQAMETGAKVVCGPGYAEGEYSAKPTDSNTATIIALRQVRRVYSNSRSDWGGHPAHDGVKVRYENGREEIVGPKTVVASLDHYTRTYEEKKARREEAEGSVAAAKARCEAAVKAIGFGTVEPVYQGYRDFRIRGWKVSFTATQAERLRVGVAVSDESRVA